MPHHGDARGDPRLLRPHQRADPGRENRFLIKSKGPQETALEFATTRDIIVIDENADVIEAPDGLQSPNETAMHLAVYRKRPEVNSVIHAHPDWVVS